MMEITLDQALTRLLEFLPKLDAPPVDGLIVFESTGRHTPSGRDIVPRERLVSVESFRPRFLELRKQGRRWVNVSICGLYEGAWLIAITAGKPGETTGETRVDLSGPFEKVQRAGWDATLAVLIEVPESSPEATNTTEVTADGEAQPIKWVPPISRHIHSPVIFEVPVGDVSFVEKVNELIEHLQSLNPPKCSGIYVFADSNSVDSPRLSVAKRRWFLTPEQYEPRFQVLLSQRRPWIHVCAYGVYEGAWLVGVSMSMHSHATDDTRIEWTGPTAKVRKGGWDASLELKIL